MRNCQFRNRLAVKNLRWKRKRKKKKPALFSGKNEVSWHCIPIERRVSGVLPFPQFLVFSMSLHAFKETLKPCTSQPSSTSITQTPSSIFRYSDLATPRKPPKSSLTQQLRRLQDPLAAPPIQPHNSHKREREQKSGEVKDEEEEEDGEEEEEEPVLKRAKFGGAKLCQFQFDHTGPFEPLVLSSNGEVPAVQVIECFFNLIRVFAMPECFNLCR